MPVSNRYGKIIRTPFMKSITVTFTLLLAQKSTAEDALYQGICRTERFNSGIIDARGAKEISISTGDILSYLEMQNLLDKINKDSKRPLPISQCSDRLYEVISVLIVFHGKLSIEKGNCRIFRTNKKV